MSFQSPFREGKGPWTLPSLSRGPPEAPLFLQALWMVGWADAEKVQRARL